MHQQKEQVKRVAALAVVAALGLVGTAAAEVSERRPAATGAAPGISVVGWDPVRAGTSVWRGAAVLREARFLRGARVPTLSPSAGGVAYVQHTPKGFAVRATGTYGGFEAKLVQVDGPRASSLAFTHDGRRVVFATARGIEIVSTLGVRRTIPTPAAWRGSTYRDFAVSPDGSLLAFSRTRGDGRSGTLRNELAIVRLDGTGARSLARNPEPYSAQYRPVFSPDGKRIAFAAADGSIASVSVAGGAATRLTVAPPRRSAWTDADPVFSRDGAWVAFTRLAGRGGSDVWVVRADGTELRRVTTTPLPEEPGTPRTGAAALAWSPDATRLLVKRRDWLGVADVASGTVTELARVGFYYEVGAAHWNR